MIARYIGKRYSLPNIQIQIADLKLKSHFVRKKDKFYKNKLAINIQTKKHKASTFKTTIMLMILPSSYFLTTFPIFLIIFCKLFIKNNFKHFIDLENIFQISKLLMFMNNSLNTFFNNFWKNLQKRPNKTFY